MITMLSSRCGRFIPHVPPTHRPVIGLAPYGAALVMLIVFGFSAAHAQDQRKRKIPVVDKLTSGSSHQAFSGKLASMDLDNHIIEVNALEGKGMEIFPVKKGIAVSTAGGGRLKINDLKPGNNVIVYYEQKGDRRTVKEIVVLAAGADEQTKKHSPPS